MTPGRRPIQSSIRFSADADAAPGADLKRAMSHWASGVAVMAVKHGARVESITINSFISVSLDPPTVLVSLSEHAAILHALNAAGRFTISVLAADQARVATLIADRLPMAHSLFEGEADPVLKGSVVTLVCALAQTHRAGDHILYLGSVERVLPGTAAPPLLYYHGSYRRLPS